MSIKKTGGGAFPEPIDAIEGMTLRDYFAAKAMQGDIASMPADHDPQSLAHFIAKRAYVVADAMLVAREDK